MSHRTYDLPPMTMLVAFEAASRTGSFKRGAQELNVTAGAISHQIRALEADLGVRLFDRVHRGVSLTAEGQSLMSVVQSAFGDLSRGVARVRGTDPERAITIAATTAVSALWLTPRITRFWRQYPEIRINQIVSDTPDPEAEGVDISIFYGKRGARKNQLLFTDTLVPLAAPSVAAACHDDTLPDLSARTLVHLTAADHRWTTWQTWFRLLGYTGEIARGVRVNNYMIALQAAQDGAGIVLGWRRLVKPMIDSGTLVPIGRHTLPAPDGFYLRKSTSRQNDDRVQMLFDWLCQTAGSDEIISSEG